ncbi:uncharacterized protein J4E79_001015 [Alternaria viburni]|uniref:uncharacterized protein n=1 Tax=Alternaria viburni TaxID=566460 RepID=UPI0020C39AB2|nr:uncharacterized protein J4E79_001015 [Alternaria viburni]KAI4668973.1 hypothetical protein J4E79_001015 [Alternaria viburni]
MDEIASTANDSEPKKLFEEADKIQKTLRNILVDLKKDVDGHCKVTVLSPAEKMVDTIKDTLSTSRVKRREKSIADKKKDLHKRLFGALVISNGAREPMSKYKSAIPTEEAKAKHMRIVRDNIDAIKRLELKLAMDMDVGGSPLESLSQMALAWEISRSLDDPNEPGELM